MTVPALLRFIGLRLAAMAALLVLVSFGVFSLLYLAPGSTVRSLLGTQQASPATIAALTREYHLNQPFLAQYWYWARNALHGDLGRSVSSLQPVTEAIRQRGPLSGFLIGYAFVLTVVVGVGLGVVAALKQGSILDRAVVGLSVFGVSAPAFATGVLLLYVFAVHWSLFPAFGPGQGFSDRLLHLTLPATALTLSAAALLVKVTRTAMVDALRQDYIAFARARGLSWSRVVFGYALRNALVPIVTSAGLILAYLLTGSVLVETAFSLPGIGQLLVYSAENKDISVVQGLALLLSAGVIAVNLLTDLIYLIVDPRIRFDSAAA